MDTIYIEQLEIETFIGTNAWEQNEKQVIYVDLYIDTDISRAAASDSLFDAIDYQDIAENITAVIGDARFQLIETVAKTIADHIEMYPGALKAQIRVAKAATLANVREVGVIHHAVYVRDLLENQEHLTSELQQ